jgi:hypothetical protein
LAGLVQLFHVISGRACGGWWSGHAIAGKPVADPNTLRERAVQWFALVSVAGYYAYAITRGDTSEVR